MRALRFRFRDWNIPYLNAERMMGQFDSIRSALRSRSEGSTMEV